MKVEYHKDKDVGWVDLLPESEEEAFNLGLICAATIRNGHVVRRREKTTLRLHLVRCPSGAERKPLEISEYT